MNDIHDADSNLFYEDFDDDFLAMMAGNDPAPLAHKILVKATNLLFDVKTTTRVVNVRFDATAVQTATFTGKFLPVSVETISAFGLTADVTIGKHTIFTSEVVLPRLHKIVSNWLAIYEHWGM